MALLHLHSCPSRPANVADDVIEASASRIADMVEKELRGDA